MNRITITALSLLLTMSAVFNNNMEVIAQEEKDPDYIMDTSKIGNSDEGYIRSEQILELGSLTSSGLSIEGEQSLRQGSLDRALTVLQRSVELAPLDMDSRILYAQTLQKKLAMQRKKQDPKLFNFTLKQWLFVYRKAEFYDQTMLALNTIFTMTGTKPKRWEKDQKFLARVMKSEKDSIKIATKDKKSDEDSKDVKEDSKPVKSQVKNRSSFDLDTELTESKQQPY